MAMRHQLKSGNTYLCNNPAASIADIGYGLSHRATPRANRYTHESQTTQRTAATIRGIQHRCLAGRVIDGVNIIGTGYTSVPPRHGVREG